MTAGAQQRLFFALWPPEPVRRVLSTRARMLHDEVGGRLVRPDTLHLTLAFLAGVDSAAVREVERAAGAVALAPFDFVLDAIGFFPHGGIAWAGAQSAPAALGQLADELRASLARAQVGFDAKPFVGHVTLLRNVGRRLGEREMSPVEWHVDRFVLVESVAAEGRRDYRVITRWPRG